MITCSASSRSAWEDCDHAARACPANENAYAKFKTPITMADYEKSRVHADPLRLLDCVMFCDGANAFSSQQKRRRAASDQQNGVSDG